MNSLGKKRKNIPFDLCFSRKVVDVRTLCDVGSSSCFVTYVLPEMILEDGDNCRGSN